MNAIEQCLKRLPAGVMGEVVHIHPLGTEVLAWAMQQQARRVVAASVEPAVLDEWRRSAAGRTGVELVDAAISDRAGPAEWLRFNLSEVNGWHEPVGLRRVYPRLQPLDRAPVRALDLAGFLAGIGGISRGDRPNLLVLEVPGMELSLLQGLSSETLRVFDWIVLRSARDGVYERAPAADALRAYLQQHFFRLEISDAQTEPLWPVSFFRFDESDAERHVLSERILALQAQISHLEENRAQLAGQVDEMKKAGDAAAGLGRERLAEVEQLTKSRDEQARLVQELARKGEELIKARDEAKKQANERLAQIDQLTKAHDDQVKLAQDRTRKADELLKARDDANKQAHERQTQIEQLTKARDEYAKQAAERQKRVAQLDAEMNDMAARHALLQEELVKAEAHVELISDLLLREPLR